MNKNRKKNSCPIGVRVKNSCFHKIGVYLFLCSFLFCFVQCKNSPQEVFQAKGGLRVLIGLDNASYTSPNDEPAAIRKQVMDALSNRIQSYGVVPYMEWQEENNCLLMEIPGVKEPAALALSNNKKLIFKKKVYEIGRASCRERV